MHEDSPSNRRSSARIDRYLEAQVLEVVGLAKSELRELILSGLFPAAECHPVWGLSWNREQIATWNDQHKSAATRPSTTMPIGSDEPGCSAAIVAELEYQLTKLNRGLDRETVRSERTSLEDQIVAVERLLAFELRRMT